LIAVLAFIGIVLIEGHGKKGIGAHRTQMDPYEKQKLTQNKRTRGAIKSLCRRHTKTIAKRWISPLGREMRYIVNSASEAQR